MDDSCPLDSIGQRLLGTLICNCLLPGGPVFAKRVERTNLGIDTLDTRKGSGFGGHFLREVRGAEQ